MLFHLWCIWRCGALGEQRNKYDRTSVEASHMVSVLNGLESKTLFQDVSLSENCLLPVSRPFSERDLNIFIDSNI